MIIQQHMQRFKRQIESFSLTLINQDPSLKIIARRPNDNFLLEATLMNGALPNSCINLFDNVGEIYHYVKKCDSSHIVIANNTLNINVTIPLEVKPIPREEILEKKVEHLQSYTLELEKRIIQLEKISKTIKPTEKKLSLPVKEIKITKDLKKPRDLREKIQEQQQDFNSTPTTAIPPSPLSLSRLDSKVANPFALKRLRPPAIPFPFQFDQTSKFIQCFAISKNTITLTRDDEQIYKVSSSQPIPSTRRHSVSFRINKITDGLIWIGLCIQTKKADQYIGEQAGIIMFALDGKRILVESTPQKINLAQFKAGNIIRMQVDIAQRKFRLYLDEKQDAMIKLPIPETIAKQKLYPFMQFISKDDSATILTE